MPSSTLGVGHWLLMRCSGILRLSEPRRTEDCRAHTPIPAGAPGPGPRFRKHLCTSRLSNTGPPALSRKQNSFHWTPSTWPRNSNHLRKFPIQLAPPAARSRLRIRAGQPALTRRGRARTPISNFPHPAAASAQWETRIKRAPKRCVPFFTDSRRRLELFLTPSRSLPLGVVRDDVVRGRGQSSTESITGPPLAGPFPLCFLESILEGLMEGGALGPLDVP